MKITRTEAGSGGRKGHSNMAHYDGTEVIKRNMKKARRRASKAVIAEQRES